MARDNLLPAVGDAPDAEQSERRSAGMGRQVRKKIGQAVRYHQNGQLARAIRIYRWFLDSQPENARVLQLYGLALHQQGDVDGAAPHLSRSVALDPDSAAAQCNLGNALYELGRLDEALACFERATDLEPGIANTHNNRGNVLRGLGRVAEAVACYRRAIDLDSALAVPHFNLANGLWDLGDMDGAIAAYRAAIAIESDYAAAHNNLGNALRTTGDLTGAVDCYARAAEADPAFALPRFNLANTLKDLDRHAEALAAYREVLGLEPDNGLARHMAAALAGERTAAAPESFVREVFDTYAGHFDSHLGTVLGYTVPEDLRDRVMQWATAAGSDGRGRFTRALDLGCGTGLVAEAFGDAVDEFDGVDLSPRMLLEARRKDVYRSLEVGELVRYLGRAGADGVAYDAVLAADTFIYIGDLEPTFAGVARCLSRGGVFAFSIEVTHAAPFELRPTGRYAQSEAYIRGLAEAHGFVVEAIEPTVIRHENGVPVEGALCILANGPVPPAGALSVTRPARAGI